MGPLLNCHSWISISIPPYKDTVSAGLMTTVQYYSPSGERKTYEELQGMEHSLRLENLFQFEKKKKLKLKKIINSLASPLPLSPHSSSSCISPE